MSRTKNQATEPLRFENGVLLVLDQNRLPHECVYLELKEAGEVRQAIQSMCVRGAPAIGIAAGYAIAIEAQTLSGADSRQFRQSLEQIVRNINGSRPTARNLFQVSERMLKVAGKHSPGEAMARLLEEARQIHNEQKQMDLALSRFGAEAVPQGAGVLTHCNTGVLATAGYGTALGVIKCAHRQAKDIRVLACETRPRLQGARLTALELKQAGVPFRLITDSMAGHFMQQGDIDLVITGADRIAFNGDTANKIGTYALAVLAGYHRLPFYIAAPSTTFDSQTPTGKDIIIEQRPGREVTCCAGMATAPEGTRASNPAFDVTPAGLITGFITEAGIISVKDISGLLKSVHN